jgi:hypothetical protein
MSFSIVYVGGGMLDKVRSVSRLESGRLDAPYMPTLTEPFIKGRRIEIPGQVTTVTDTFKLNFPVELLSIAIGADKYQSKDYWNLFVGEAPIIETIYTKQLPEGINLTVVKPIPANTPITFSFVNEGGAPKTVWYNLQFLKGAES